MPYTFEANQLVVNLLPGERMTAGRAYRVHSSYDGHSGCGAQEWCRVADDTGRVVGFDPDRFILASREGLTPNDAVCALALRSRKTLGGLLSEFQGESFRAVRTKLQGLFDDATGIVAETAAYPVEDQITLQDVSGLLPFQSDLKLQCVVGVGTVPVGWLRYGKNDDAYTLTLDDETVRLAAADYHEALVEVQAHIKRLADGEDVGFWAIVRHVDTTEERQQEFTAALG